MNVAFGTGLRAVDAVSTESLVLAGTTWCPLCGYIIYIYLYIYIWPTVFLFSFLF